MGSIIGKQSVAEPAFDVLLNRNNHHVQCAYEIRKYGERFAAAVAYQEGDDMGSPFRTLAGYIGVFGDPQNEGEKPISMTAPVVVEDARSSSGTPIAMTAPVVMENNQDGDSKTMKFILPAEYDDISKVPKPTNPAVHIEEIPPQMGAVHVFSGLMSEATNQKMAAELGRQLESDGVDGMSEEYAVGNFQFWGYNPPFTIPIFRRNEVWVELTEAQVDQLLQKYGTNDTPKN